MSAKPLLGVALFVALATAAAAGAQDIFGPQPGGSAWGPRLDTAYASAASRVIWRGYDIGAGATAGAAIGIRGRSVTAAGIWSLAALLGGTAVDRRAQAPLGTHATASVELARRLGAGDAQLRAWGGGYLLHDDPAGSGAAAAGIALEELAVPWLPEVAPRLRAGVMRAGGPLRGTYIDAALRQTVGIRQYAAYLELGSDWNDAGRARFTPARLAGAAGLSAGLGRSRWTLNIDGGALRADDITLGWGRAGVTWRN